MERLKRMCEHSMLASISIENAASILHAADLYNVRACVVCVCVCVPLCVYVRLLLVGACMRVYTMSCTPIPTIQHHPPTHPPNQPTNHETPPILQRTNKQTNKQITQAAGLRTKVLAFVLQHFDAVSKTKAFEEMARENVDLVVEVLRKR
jgi:hypothetical protein